MQCYQSTSAKEKGAFLTALTKAAHHGNLSPKISTHTIGMSIAYIPWAKVCPFMA